ncbi:MAG: hypothetical protein ACK5ME_01065 [Parahaliea sp.]
MNVLETDWWTLLLPPEWWAEHEEESILIGDIDDVGCIEVSTLHKFEGEFDRAEVLSIAQEETSASVEWKILSCGDFEGVSAGFVEEDTAIREWYLARGPHLLFISYSCEVSNRGMDDAAVDEILDTLSIVQSASQK